MNIAIVGAGALARIFYLPVFKRMGLEVYELIDPNKREAQKLAEEYGIKNVVANIEEVTDEIDAVIIASPNFLHYEQTLFFLQKGKHVLLEKPMAGSQKDALGLIEAAKKNNAILQIGMMRRYWKINKAAKSLLQKGILGSLELLSLQEGGVMDWPVQSFAVFSAVQSLGGVLIDTGSHTLDLLCWWADDTISELAYEDDNRGGVESDCHLQVVFSKGAKGLVRLSRIRKMPNEFLLQGSKGWLKIKPYNNLFEASSKEIEKEVYKLYSAKELQNQSFNDLFEEQIRCWINSITEQKEVAVTAASVLPSIALIEDSYEHRTQMVYPFN